MRAMERRKEYRQRSAADLAQEFRDAVRAAPHTTAKTEPLPAITVGSFGDVARGTENFVSAGSDGPGAAAFDDGRSPATAAVGGADDAIAAVEPPVFASNLSSRDWPSGVGKLLLAGGIAVVFLVLSAAGALTLWWRMSTNEVGREQQFDMNSNAVSNLARNPGTASNSPSPRPPDPGAEFDRIRAVSDSTAEPERNPALMRDIKTAEGRFPEDYRFTYLRAKLEITRSREHHEAFETLFRAGEKAIKAGKSANLLDDLQRDKTSALRRLTDHKEWSVLMEALRKNDTELLKIAGH